MDGTSTGIAVAEIDLAAVEAVRRKMPVVSHQRPDLYAAAVDVVMR